MMEWLVNRASLEGMTVLDPFMGSGTTGVACIKLQRHFIGCEINPKYFATAEKRLEQASLQQHLFTPSNNRLHLTGWESGQQNLFSAGDTLPAKLPAKSPRR